MLAVISACSSSYDSPEEQYKKAVETLARPEVDEYRFYALTEAAKGALAFGSEDAAEGYARELVELAELFPKDWNYGNAVHDGNAVLGRIALRRGSLDEAKRLLVEAGNTPGSPQLNSFGPNMSLALDLLNLGERDVVLEYLKSCRGFWSRGHTQLSEWETQIKEGKVPDFGYHLHL